VTAPTFEFLPAVDVRDGRAVRLVQGDFHRETVYGEDPVAVARAFAEAGAGWIHVVDLDAARTGEPANRATVEAMCAAVAPFGVRVQSGGGVRDEGAAVSLVEAGVDRVVVGTAAVEDDTLVNRLADRLPGQVAVGLDARGREVAVRGWAEGSGVDVVDLARRLTDAGVAALIVTQIARDGTMAGPDLDGLATVLEATSVPVIASGGVGALAHVRALAMLDAGGRRLAGVVVGRALYEGRFGLGEALAVSREARASAGA
jgi:phosphoribosylformimino-5-aminoimidazole carboxamide ribotide isomerase